MAQKMKNKTYQPIPLVVNGQTIIVTSRKTLDEVEEVTPQMVTLKSVGMVQIIKK
jgi:hypothetical protein